VKSYVRNTINLSCAKILLTSVIIYETNGRSPTYATAIIWTLPLLRLMAYHCTGMRRITTFRSTTDRIYDGGPILYYEYNIL